MEKFSSEAGAQGGTSSFEAAGYGPGCYAQSFSNFLVAQFIEVKPLNQLAVLRVDLHQGSIEVLFQQGVCLVRVGTFGQIRDTDNC